jgi:type II secretory pathway pseudopilin PulG
MSLSSQRGFTYVIVMFAVAIAAIASTRAMEGMAAAMRQSREEELLNVGQMYRDAIRSYHDNSLGVLPEYPKSLDALLEDDRTSTKRRHLRKKFPDPLTGESFGLVIVDDRIVGVYSKSVKRPQKIGGFTKENETFANAISYQDWKFVHQPH